MPRFVALICVVLSVATAVAEKPNVVFILADDLGYGDLGCYGQKRIRAPNIDRLAADGLRFTDCYAGCTVCAPSRCALLTGKHMGHAAVRGNSHTTLGPDVVTIGAMLKQAGYATGIVGKWGMGDPGTTGVPSQQGFDDFYGYLNHVHAHNYWPDHLYTNAGEVPLPGNVVERGVAVKRQTYAPDACLDEGLAFLQRHRQQPFFLYYASTLPHANNEAGQQGMEIPSDAPYSAESWPSPQRHHAAMITRLDADVGKLLARLRELGLERNTIVFFSSDNGPHKEGGGDPAFFASAGGLRGYKRALYEGGIRTPMIAYWPGRVPAGKTSSLAWAFWDVMPTLAELCGAKPPGDLDGISIVPTLLGSATAGRAQAEHAYLYWEFHERGFQQAVRQDKWKAVRLKPGEPIELYDLAADPGETRDLAAMQPEIIARMEAILATARVDNPLWPVTKGAPRRDP